MRKLDKTRSFGTITPLHNGAAFYQDGLHFATDGTCLDDPSITEQPTQPEGVEPVVPPVAEGVKPDTEQSIDLDGDVLAQVNAIKTWFARKQAVGKIAGRFPKTKADVEPILRDGGFIA